MTAPSPRPRRLRFFLGLIALGVAVAYVIVIPRLGGQHLVHRQDGEALILYVVLPALLIAVWGVTTGGPRLSISEEKATGAKAKRAENRLKLGCTAVLFAPIGSAAMGFLAANASHVLPMDRASLIFSYAIIGFVVGGVVFAAILLSSIFE